MWLEQISLSQETANKLFDKLEQYNSKHPGEQITAQRLAEKLLDYAIRYVPANRID